MIEVVSLFRQRDTRDELGLGSIRDAFADLFFPGTSTLQTRARYCLFVPWLYGHYEQLQVPSGKVSGRLRADEVHLSAALKASGSGEGVIGAVAGASLQRFPSSVYWNGLRRWGILRYMGDQARYHRSLDRYYQRQGERPRTDDGEPIDGWGEGNWDPDLPPPPQGFPERASFALTPKEAEYLRERVMLACADSLLATLLDRCTPVDDTVTFIWRHPELGSFPPQQREWVRHAENFSQAMVGAVLLYNLMLAQQSGRQELGEEYQTRMQDWRKALETRGYDLLGWDRSAFWQLMRRYGRVPAPTQRFVDAWLDILLGGGHVADVTARTDARDLIHTREVHLKRGRSRFESQRHLEMWSGAAGLGQLDFRWSVARRLTNDILQGLVAGEEPHHAAA